MLHTTWSLTFTLIMVIFQNHLTPILQIFKPILIHAHDYAILQSISLQLYIIYTSI